ncbi:hypothetical protein GR140_19040 [Pseudomonas putida]|uniref:hypothetical protein n=1 Tax=Pseudomonas putida TaxID=303 RepID=UPI001BAEDE80|nr:hypothetical protein [Pseudomonas putida]QUG90762.1 hypothetical protein GR140_19040 [Pseudomonas putida]
MVKKEKPSYADFIREIRAVCEDNHNLEYHSGLYLTNNRNKFHQIKKDVSRIYERYEHLVRRVHFIEIPESKHSSVKLTYTHKFKRVTTTKRIEEAYARLAKDKPMILEVSQVEDVLSGKIKMYERSTEKRIYYSFTDGEKWVSEQMNVGVATVMLTSIQSPVTTNSTEKKINRLSMLNSTISNGYGDYFRLDAETKLLLDMLTI